MKYNNNFVASLPDSVRRELNRQRIRLDAADLYGSHAVDNRTICQG